MDLLKTARCLIPFALLLGTSPAAGQTYSDGDMDIEMWVTEVWIESDDETYDEFTWKFWGADNGNVDGQGWRGGQCFTADDWDPGWFNISDQMLFSQAYGGTVPQYLQLQGQGWEDDRGGRCDLNQNGEWYEDDDDQHCSRRTLTSTLDYRQLPPGQLTSWVDVFSSGCGNDDIGAEVRVKWSPPRPDNAKINGQTGTVPLCDGGVMNLSSDGGAVFGGVYYWTTSTGEAVGTANPLTLNVPASDTTYRVYTRNGTTNSKSYRTVTADVVPPPATDAGPDVEICRGQSATLTASGGDSYTWSTGATQTSITVSPTSTTTYSVTAIGPGGCSASDSVTITVHEDVGTWRPDDDEDGYGSDASSLQSCPTLAPSGWTTTGGDCDDEEPAVNPNASEICNDIDDDCDGATDDGDSDLIGLTAYLDNDGDGFGDDASTMVACEPPDGYILIGGDCDDDPLSCGAACNPEAEEICDGFDNDCDGASDDSDDDVRGSLFYFPDQDGDGYGVDAEGVRSCDPPDGTVELGGDCDDDPLSCGAACNPEAPEICDGFDNDCDGARDDSDDDITGLLFYFPDQDGDGYGVDAEGVQSCDPPDGAVELGGGL